LALTGKFLIKLKKINIGENVCMCHGCKRNMQVEVQNQTEDSLKSQKV